MTPEQRAYHKAYNKKYYEKHPDFLKKYWKNFRQKHGSELSRREIERRKLLASMSIDQRIDHEINKSLSGMDVRKNYTPKRYNPTKKEIIDEIKKSNIDKRRDDKRGDNKH